MFAKASEIFSGEWKDKRILFVVTEDDVQEVARRILGRELTEEELYRASKGIEAGLSHCLDIVLETAVKDAVN